MDFRPIPTPGITHATPVSALGDGHGPNPNRAEIEHRVVPAEKVETASADRHPRMPLAPSIRVELHIDEATKQVFGRVIDRNTGEPVREIPAQELRNLQAHVRELVHAIVDETA